jgi:dolichol-phosphate mannosyltransferase
VTSVVRHWLKFNLVGIIGVAVQLVVLTFLTSALGINYLIATILAVEATILHNFIWHEHWTWIDRTRNASGIAVRLLRFNMANGLISLTGNSALMWILVTHFRMHYILANLGAIGICSFVNFLVSDRLVFQYERRS